MILPDIIFIVRWWLMFFVIGLIFLPLTIRIFSNFFDRGYIFAKIIGIAIISYVIFVLGIFKILPFTELTIGLTILSFLILNIFLISKSPNILVSLRNSWRILVFEELLFLLTLFFWSYIRGHQPDIHGLEKYMDFGFINSIMRSEHFPPADMWFTPLPINYYYFGHLVTAVLTKLSNIPSSITYNLMLSTIFALTFTCAFSIGATLWRGVTLSKTRIGADLRLKSTFICGFLAGFLATIAGNLHTIYSFFKPYANENPVAFWQLAFSFNTFPNSYWYPNATRFIHNTIHEFPIYSFVVSDLHGHFLDIPFVLLIIGVLLSLFFNLKIENLKLKILLISFLLAVMYMTNAWDGIIYFLLTVIVITYLKLKQNHDKLFNIGLLVVLAPIIIGVGSILFSLPFSINFKPFASGIGILCAPEFLTNIGKLGPFLFEKDHCLRSPLWQLAILYGFFYFWVISFVVFLSRFVILSRVKLSEGSRRILRFAQNDITHSDIFILLLILLSTLLIIIPEFIYVKDIYPGHYRANTMFKLVYQAFIMLSIASAYIIVRMIPEAIRKLKTRIPNIFNFYFVFFIFSFLFLILVMIYPYFAINAYYGNLKTYYGLDGTLYLKNLYPTDYEGILWINKNIKGQPVVLEAQGDSYTDYARVSSNTGLPTVLGWPVHEWLWRGTYDIPSPRIAEVQKMYESEDLGETKELLKKYKVSLVFIGTLERQKYPKLDEERFKTLGKIIYQNGNTRIYKIIN